MLQQGKFLRKTLLSQLCSEKFEFARGEMMMVMAVVISRLQGGHGVLHLNLGLRTFLGARKSFPFLFMKICVSANYIVQFT